MHLISDPSALQHPRSREHRQLAPQRARLGAGNARDLAQVKRFVGVQQQQAQHPAAVGAEEQRPQIGRLLCFHFGYNCSLFRYIVQSAARLRSSGWRGAPPFQIL